MVIHFNRILFHVSKALLGIVATVVFASICMADTNVTKISPEQAFLQGQQYLTQKNLPQAELSLTRIDSISPYAKLLAGNIANQKGDIDQTFLLLLPLQANNSLLRPALASLHASLADAYQKQGDASNALDQLIRKETYLKNSEAIESNHQKIWQLLSPLSTENLISLRGNSVNTTTQGWIDLSLSAKNQNVASSIATWQNSYLDHVAISFANTLLATKTSSVVNNKAMTLKTQGNVALIFPFDDPRYAEQANAFKLGLQAAFTKHGVTNIIKIYSSIVNPEGITDAENLGDLRAFAKDEGAGYLIGPMPDIELFINDEARAIAKFATRNAMQNVLVIASESTTSNQVVERFSRIWQNQLGNQANLIKLTQDTLDLNNQIQAIPHDLLILAISADELRAIRAELDISTPTIGFSSIYEADVIDDKPLVLSNNIILNAIRWADIPFLFDALLPEKNQQFAEYQADASGLASHDLKRWFALGVDYLPILIASESSESSMMNGLTGQISVEQSGVITRDLPIAKLTYDGLVFE